MYTIHFSKQLSDNAVPCIKTMYVIADWHSHNVRTEEAKESDAVTEAA